jgi:hypothetical protein
MNQARTAESTYHHLGAHNVYYVKLNVMNANRHGVELS